MNAYTETVLTPAGPFTFAVNDSGAILWARFDNGTYRPTDAEERALQSFTLREDPARTARAAEQLREYTAGHRRAFDLPVILDGTPWQQSIWTALQRIPFGETRTYAQLAEMVGRPTAVRAVGRANATNRIPLIIPCHRVIGASGSLTGFAGGPQLKAALLEHEARVASGQPLTSDAPATTTVGPATGSDRAWQTRLI